MSEILASVPMYRGGPADLWAAGVPIHDACLQCGCLYVGFQSLVVALLPRQWVICQEFVAAKYPFRARDASLQSWDRSRPACSLHKKLSRMKQKICDGLLPFDEDLECVAGSLQSVLSRCQVWLCDGLHVAEVCNFDMLFVCCWSFGETFRRAAVQKGVSSKVPRS